MAPGYFSTSWANVILISMLPQCLKSAVFLAFHKAIFMVQIVKEKAIKVENTNRKWNSRFPNIQLIQGSQTRRRLVFIDPHSGGSNHDEESRTVHLGDAVKNSKNSLRHPSNGSSSSKLHKNFTIFIRNHFVEGEWWGAYCCAFR